MKHTVHPSPVNNQFPHTFECSVCKAVRTLRQRDWLIHIYCNIFRRKTYHSRKN